MMAKKTETPMQRAVKKNKKVLYHHNLKSTSWLKRKKLR
jgi:hypothetical protein